MWPRCLAGWSVTISLRPSEVERLERFGARFRKFEGKVRGEDVGLSVRSRSFKMEGAGGESVRLDK